MSWQSSRTLDGLIGSDCLDGLDDRRHQRVGIAFRANEEPPSPSFLVDGLVDGHGRIGNDVLVVEVGYDAHDTARVVADADELHERRSSAWCGRWPPDQGKLGGDALADDDDAIRLFPSVSEVAAFEERNAQSGEEPG